MGIRKNKFMVLILDFTVFFQLSFVTIDYTDMAHHWSQKYLNWTNKSLNSGTQVNEIEVELDEETYFELPINTLR